VAKLSLFLLPFKSLGWEGGNSTILDYFVIKEGISKVCTTGYDITLELILCICHFPLEIRILSNETNAVYEQRILERN